MNSEKVRSSRNCFVKCPKDLCDKIHIRPKPNCSLLFAASKLGKSIWQKTPANDFTFYDPHNRETPARYNPLYDPHLKPFFMRKVHLSNLRKNNFITDNNEVICSGAKEYNGYRKFLHRLKTEAGAATKRLEYENDLDWHRVKIANLLCDKIGMKQRKFLETYDDGSRRCVTMNPVRYEGLVEIMKRRKQEIDCERHERFKTAAAKYNERLNEIQQIQLMKERDAKDKAFRRNINIANKQMLVTDKQKKRHIQMKKKIAEQDKALRRKMVRKFNNQPMKTKLIVKCPMEI